MRSLSCCYGYARVSTDSQSVEARIAALTAASAAVQSFQKLLNRVGASSV
jgi:DNA invertase Pin-like site-specific DNA recombinase